MIICSGGLKKICWGHVMLPSWNHRKLAYWIEHLLNKSLPLLLKMPQLRWDRCLCSEWAAPILIASCSAALTATAVPQRSIALPHHLKLCTRSSLKRLSALPCRVTGKLVCVWPTLHLLADGVTKSNPFWRHARKAEWEVHWPQVSWAGAEDDRCAESRSSLLQERVGSILWILADGLFHCQETLGFSQRGVWVCLFLKFI